MTSITTRSGKGSALTHTEMDNNLTSLNSDKLEASDIKGSTGVTVSTDTAGDPNISIGQAVGTGDNVQFNQVTASLVGNVTGTVSSLSNHDTADLSEGTNLYYTNARADARIAAASIGALADVDVTGVANNKILKYNGTSGNWEIADDSDTEDDLSNNNTDDLSEGSNNFYFTDARARQSVSVTDAGGDGSLAYNNSTGVITYTGPSASEVRAHFSAGEGIDISSGAISGEDATDSNKGIASFSSSNFTVSSGAVSIKTDGVNDTHIDFGTGTNQVSTADVPEQTNLYYTDGRFDTRLGTKTTDNLTEGSSNLYFTNARADARVQAASIADLSDVDTTGISVGQVLSYDSAGNFVATDMTGGGSGTITALNNQAANRLTTIGATTTELDGEANLTFNGTTLTISGNLDVDVNSGGTRHTELTNASSTGSGFQCTLGTGGAAHTSGNHYIYRTSTSTGFSTRATLAGDGTHTFEADSSAHGSTMPLVLKSTNSGYNRQQLRLTDAGNSQTDILARKAGNSVIYQVVLDTGQDTTYATSDAVGDIAVYHVKDGDNDRVNTTIYGANDKHIYSVFGGNSTSYANTPMEIVASKMTLPRTIENDTSYLANTVAEFTSTDNGYGRSQVSLKSSDARGEVHLSAIGGATGGGDNVGGLNVFLDVGSTPQSGDAAGDYLHQIRFNQTQNRQEWNVYGANNGFNLGVFKGNSGSYGYAELQVDAGNIDLNANGATTIDTTEFTVNSSGAITLNADSDSSGNELFKLQESGTDVLSFNRGPDNDAELVFKGDAIFIKNASNQTLFSIDDSGTTQGVTGFNPDRTKTGVLSIKRNDSTTTYNGTYSFRVDGNTRKFAFEITDDVGSDGTTEIFSVEDSAGSGTATPKDIFKFAVPPVLPSFTVANLPTTVVAGAQAFCTNDAGGAVPVFYDGSAWRRVTDRTVAST